MTSTDIALSPKPNPPRYYAIADHIPFTLAPSSRPSSPSSDYNITTASLTWDRPRLITSRFIGQWSVSPWSSGSKQDQVKAVVDDIPLDMRQFQEWHNKKKKRTEIVEKKVDQQLKTTTISFSSSKTSIQASAKPRSTPQKDPLVLYNGDDEISFGIIGGGGGLSLGDDEEILFEGGCTQMLLPLPTQQTSSNNKFIIPLDQSIEMERKHSRISGSAFGVSREGSEEISAEEKMGEISAFLNSED